MTPQIHEAFLRLKMKIENLIAQNAELTAENEELINQILELKEQNENLMNAIDEIENKALSLQSDSTSKVESNQKLNNLIDEIIKEIDKVINCIKADRQMK